MQPALGEHHRVADAAGTDRLPGAAHDAAGLQPDRAAQRRALERARRQQPQRHHHVAKVERRGGHLDLDVVRSQGCGLVALHRQAADLPRVVHGQAVGGILAGRDPREPFPEADQPRHPEAVVPYRQLALPQVAAVEPGQGIQILARVQIHQAEVEPRSGAGIRGHLLVDGAQRPPRGTGARIAHLDDGAPRHHGQAALRARLRHPVRYQRLDEGDQTPRQVLAGGIVRIVAAQEVDRLHVGGVRPVGQLGDAVVRQLRVRDGGRRTPGLLEPREPVVRQAARFADHPARGGMLRGPGVLEGSRRRLQEVSAASRT